MKKIAFILAILMLSTSVFGCGGNTENLSDDALDTPEIVQPEVDLYTDFRETDLFDQSLYHDGFYISTKNKVCRTVESKYQSIILPLELYSIYAVRLVAEYDVVKGAMLSYNPLTLQENESRDLTDEDTLLEMYIDTEIPEIICYPKSEGMYALIYLSSSGKKETVEIGKSTVLLDSDTEGDWWIPEKVGPVNGSALSWADWSWNSDQIYSNLYDPLVEKYPDYVSSEVIGVDQTGKYPIRCYTFEPHDYEQIIILNSGMHGNEIDAYLALAKFLQLLAEEDGSHAGLHYVRTKVKLVVIPIVNVWSSNNNHIYRNSDNVNINRDYIALTQSETKAVTSVLEKYKGVASAILDFHCYGTKDTRADLYYKCYVSAPNAPALYKTVNHIYQRLCEQGLAHQPALLSNYPVDSLRGNHTLLGTAWNVYDIPSVTVEHGMGLYYDNHSADSITLALENFGNLIIQHALLKIRTMEN